MSSHSATKLATVSEPNITPMLDVLLVVIIIFLAAIQGNPSMNVQLPVKCTGTCGSSEPIVLEVHAGGLLKINGVDVPAGALATRIRSLYAGRPDKSLQIAGYPGASYATVFTAMDIAKSAGATILGIVPKEAYLDKR